MFTLYVLVLISPSLRNFYHTIFVGMQRGVSDKTVSQLEKSVSSKLEATVARQLQAQFQTSGKQALQVNIMQIPLPLT